jgi:hypothetical protein
VRVLRSSLAFLASWRLILLVVACHEQSMDAVGVSTVRAAPSTLVDAAAVKPSPVAADFRDHMTRVVARQVSEGHGERFDAIVWANEGARVAWESGGDMPEGAMLVEEAVQRAAKGDRAAGFFTMEKRDGAWRFVAVGVDGDVADDARTARCASCHAQAPRDDVFRVAQNTTTATTAAITATAPTSVASAAATYDARSAGPADAASSR